jgi:DNA (cytosine-5)-methyltransferase 1
MANEGSKMEPLGTALSMFSGAGGLDLGLEMAGFATVGCIELDRAARNTLRLNRPAWPLLEPRDVTLAAQSLRPKDLGLRRRELDLLVGGPPCQPFSKAAQWRQTGRTGMLDSRADAIHGMLEIAESFLPKAILLENVAGFLKGPVSARKTIEEGLQRINRACGTAYRLDTVVLDAANYGLPQHRLRAIAVACRNGTPFIVPSPTHSKARVTAWDVLADLPEVTWSPRAGSWAELLPSIPEGGNYLYLTARGGGAELFGWRSRYWSFLLKLARDRPSWTLPASPGPSTGPFHWDNRPLTVRERLRLQGFPDNWQLCGSLNQQVKMSGNATPPPLAEAVGRELVRQLKLGDPRQRDHILQSRSQLVATHRLDCPAPVDPVPVPVAFECMAGPKQAHPGTGLGPAPRNHQSSSQVEVGTAVPVLV